MSRWPALEDELVAAAGRLEERQAAPRARRSPRRVAIAALAATALLGGIAFAATRLLSTGRPVPASPGRHLLGAIVPGTTRLLSVRAADLDGGPPWGLRIYRTKSGSACAQVGRVQDGQLGVIGKDGAFGDDGKFHPLPVQGEDCGGLDAHHQLFMEGGANAATASAYDGSDDCETPQERRLRALTPRSIRAALRLQVLRHERAAARVERRVLARYLRRARESHPACPAADLRDVVFGFAGERARSVTLDDHQTQLVLRPSAAESGAYIAVLRGDVTQHRDLHRTVTYDNGLVCPTEGPSRPPRGCQPPPGFAAAPRSRAPSVLPAPAPPLHVPIAVLPHLEIRFVPPFAGHRYEVVLACSHRIRMEEATLRPRRADHPVTVRLHPVPAFCRGRTGEVRDDTERGRLVGRFRLGRR